MDCSRYQGSIPALVGPVRMMMIIMIIIIMMMMVMMMMTMMMARMTTTRATATTTIIMTTTARVEIHFVCYYDAKTHRLKYMLYVTIMLRHTG